MDAKDFSTPICFLGVKRTDNLTKSPSLRHGKNEWLMGFPNGGSEPRQPTDDDFRDLLCHVISGSESGNSLTTE